MTFARRSLPWLDSGRTREAWRTKNTNTRLAMRSVRADTKDATWGEGGGWNWDKYSDLRISANALGMFISLTDQGHALKKASRLQAKNCGHQQPGACDLGHEKWEQPTIKSRGR